MSEEDRKDEDMEKSVEVPVLEDRKELNLVDENVKQRKVDKVVYVAWVAYTMLVTVAVSSKEWRGLLPWLFCLAYPVLVVYRYFEYKPRKWQYFLLDWCYAVDLTLMVFLIAKPTPYFATVLFYCAFANLPWATYSLRNSLVFYSTDRMTSCFIHTVPMAVMFSVRFFPEDTGRLWHHDFVSDPDIAAQVVDEVISIDGVSPLVMLSIVTPVFIALLHLVYQYLSSGFVLSLRLDPSYLTLYTMSLKDPLPNSRKRLMALCGGPKSRPAVHSFFSWLYQVRCVTLAGLFFHFRPAAIAFASGIFLVISWNAAGFLMEYHSIRYAYKPPNKRTVEIPRETYMELLRNQKSNESDEGVPL